jgi:hypothetical protein
MSRRLTHTAAVALAALACGLGAAACGEDASSKEQQAAEVRWQAGVPRWRADMLAALNQISLMLSNGQTVADLHRGKPRTIAQLDRYERRLEECAAAIGRLGEAPGVLEPVRKEALKTCHALVRGAGLVRDGVAAWRAGLVSNRDINHANVALGNGQRGLERVRARLKTALAG